MWSHCGFFFQAEDGIRDLVRSRGLGDVYKRQGFRQRGLGGREGGIDHRHLGRMDRHLGRVAVAHGRPAPVSYTHLTLPTSDLV